MKKIVVCIFAMLLYGNILTAQGGEYLFGGSALNDYHLLTSPSIQTPDVTAFQKVTQIPVSHYTGRTNVSIPIYEVNTGGVSIPISLTYNSSGVKVADTPSNVGSNWSLNAGGVVTRMVKGIDDFTLPRPIKEFGSEVGKTTAGWLSKALGFEPFPKQSNDPIPDVFNVSAPGLSTKFIHEKAKLNKSILSVTEIENNGNIIESYIGDIHTETYTVSGGIIIKSDHLPDNTLQLTARGVKKLKVKSLKGLEYVFGESEVVSSFTSGKWLRSFDSNNFYLKSNALKLSSIHDFMTNQTVNFEYEEYKNYFKNITRSRSVIGNKITNRSVVSKRLKYIYFDGGKVEFVYGVQREDDTGEKALTEVIVYNHLEEVVQKTKLEYGYFQSSIVPDSPYSKRLRLDAVYNVNTNDLSEVGKYKFSYNISSDMPPRHSMEHDFLGYNNWNGSELNSVPVPKIYYEIDNYEQNYSTDGDLNKMIKRVYSPFSNGTDPKNDDGINRVGNFTLEANEVAAKAYILTSIEYPTGGKTEFDYESNEFYYKGIKKGGGLRIKSQKTIDEYGVSQIQNYSYVDGKINSLPSYVSYEDGMNKVHLHNTPKSVVELTSGAFVGYRRVTVSNAYDEQETTYDYFNASDYPNIPSHKNIFGGYKSNKWRALAQYSLYVDKDILRGKLRGKQVKNKYGLTVLKQKIEYELKSFKTLDYGFQNGVPQDINGQRNCFFNGVYNRDCGGYDETISFPIERNLIASVKTQVLEDVHSEDDPDKQEFASYVETEKRYDYMSDLPLVQRERSGKGFYARKDECDDRHEESKCQNPDLEYVGKSYRYPEVNSLLGGQNRLAEPEFVTFFNEKGNIKTEDYHYKDFGNGILGLEKVAYHRTKFENTAANIPVIVTKRDAKGNILESVTEEGLHTSYIYGYGSRYLIAELKNVSYSNLESSAVSLSINLQSLINTNDDSTILSKLQQLRTHFSKGEITSYTFKPLVGITSVTDIRGRKLTYEYDTNNRLVYVKDNEGNIISQNTYNFKN